MKTMEEVRHQLHTGSFDFSRHALRCAVERNVSEEEIRQAGLRATIIESYPGDKYSPSCLLLGFTTSGPAFACPSFPCKYPAGENYNAI